MVHVTTHVPDYHARGYQRGDRPDVVEGCIEGCIFPASHSSGGSSPLLEQESRDILHIYASRDDEWNDRSPTGTTKEDARVKAVENGWSRVIIIPTAGVVCCFALCLARCDSWTYDR